MPLTTYTAGEILTASSLNSNLTAAGGLQFIKSQTIGTGVASVTVTGAFSANYDNYLITVSGGVASTDLFFGFKLGATTTNYYSGIAGVTFAGTASTNGRNNTEPHLLYAGSGSSNGLQMSYMVQNPFLTKYTFCSGPFIPYNAMYSQAGSLQTTTSYTDFTINVVGGTITGGTISVYGYAK